MSRYGWQFSHIDVTLGEMKPGPKRTKNWGLAACPAERACAVCAAFGEMPDELRRVREMYVEGMPPWLVAQFFGVPNGDLRSHAWRHNWCRRRSYNLPDPKHLIMVAALNRLQKSQHLASSSSADRMLKLLVSLVESETHSRKREAGSIRWEE